MNKEKKLLNTLKGKKYDIPPVWMMRQAGRYLPQYRKVREKFDFMTMCKTPEVATEVTLQPVDEFNMDGAILFSDILVVPEAMGMKLEFVEGKGPVFESPIRTREDIEKLSTDGIEEKLSYVFEALKLIKMSLNEDKTLIGFAGAPITLAAYMVEGASSRNYIYLKSLMYNDTRSFNLMMDKLVNALEIYYKNQVKSGAEVLMLFDTFAGIFSPFDYERYIFPFVKKLVEKMKKNTPETPVIYFPKGGANFYNLLKQLKIDGVSVDWTISLIDADKKLDSKFTLQGNLDPVILFADYQIIERETKRVLSEGRQLEKGHIFNLGHGILPKTPVDSVKKMLEVIRAGNIG
ncbi:uroporphyrinogen decarboxylase [Thermotomaculum hydrothermale]|uniref:Uroporphyrinogen decarboxylase n=1 Tax=Thermotomaculum hydrothermale TaxID=981385 RepID=A0A7R6PJ20_9BACT|nr:uroporphyrinogen decarboxylase [Thermotomaculum hydrothermale]BBB33504.1 uroporphyrinogen decarboxylase [Thermotomaculum hydrothermale]